MPEILQSTDQGPQTAVCRGAVMHGLTVQNVKGRPNVDIVARVVRSSYGVCWNEPWKKGKHAFKDKSMSLTQGEVAKNQMRWFLKKGERVTTKKPIMEMV